MKCRSSTLPLTMPFAVALLCAVLWLAPPGGSDMAQAQSPSPGRAGLVVVLPDQEPLTFCVETGQGITGVDLLDETGMAFIADYSNSLGAAICKIEDVGCTYPSQDCFCQCQGATCTYWSYHFLSPGETQWTYAQFGAGQSQVEPGSVEAWVWSSGDSGSTQVQPPALAFTDICSGQISAAQAATGGADGESVNWLSYLAFAGLLTILLATAILRRRTTT